MYCEPCSWRTIGPCGQVLADSPEAFPHALADRLKRLEARAPRGGMDVKAACRAMIDRDMCSAKVF